VPLPSPEPGLVVRYDYLWHDEHRARREARKDRPACLVAASDPSATPRFVVLLAITHTRPVRGTTGVELPPSVRKALGLDDAPSWIIVSEYNVDEWPNPGLQQLPGRPGVFAHGFVPPRLFAKVKAAFLDLARVNASKRVTR
jgi:hypothetical protein